MDVAAVNAYLLYNYTASMSGIKTITENDFKDHLVLRIIESYGKLQRRPLLGRPPRAPERIKHGSCIYLLKERSRCQYCRIKGVKIGHNGNALIVIFIQHFVRYRKDIATQSGISLRLMNKGPVGFIAMSEVKRVETKSKVNVVFKSSMALVLAEIKLIAG